MHIMPLLHIKLPLLHIKDQHLSLTPVSEQVGQVCVDFSHDEDGNQLNDGSSDRYSDAPNRGVVHQDVNGRRDGQSVDDQSNQNGDDNDTLWRRVWRGKGVGRGGEGGVGRGGEGGRREEGGGAGRGWGEEEGRKGVGG